MEIYGSIKLKGSLEDGTGDPLLTKDESTNSVGTAANALGELTSAHIFVGNVSNVPTDVAVSGDISIDNTGLTAIASGVIVNADVKSDAAIGLAKLGSLTASRAVVSDASGVLTVSATTSTQVGYLSDVTGLLQNQIDGKQATITGAATTAVSSNFTANRVTISNGSGKFEASSITSTELSALSSIDSNIQDQLDTKLAPTITSVAEGDILMYNGTTWVNLARGTNGQTLKSSATSIEWDTPTINGIPVGGTDGQVLTKQSGTDFDADWETLTVSSITDLTATAAELNILDGATIDVTELNFLENASANIQTQINNKLSTSLTTDSIFKGVAGVATATTDLPTGITIGGAVIYRVGGTDVTLADGGTGASLADPGADRILFWDDSAGTVTWLTVGSGVSITDTTITATGSVPGSDTQVVFNDSGSFGADAGMVYDKTNNALTVGTYARISTFTGNAVVSGALFIGNNAGNFTNTGQYVLGIGVEALTDLTSAGAVVAVGHKAGSSITTGSDNTLIGHQSGLQLTTGAENTSVGRDAMASTAVDADFNTALGSVALFNVEGDENVAIGYRTGEDITTGNSNTILGTFAADGLTTGSQNVIIGANVDAQSNTANGQLSIQNAIFGTSNVGTTTTVSSGNLGFYATTWGTSAAKVISVGSGTAPSTSITDGFQMYSADIAAGNAAAHFRTENGGVIKLYEYVDAAFGNTVNTGDGDTDALINALVSALTAHGLIATS